MWKCLCQLSLLQYCIRATQISWCVPHTNADIHMAPANGTHPSPPHTTCMALPVVQHAALCTAPRAPPHPPLRRMHMAGHAPSDTPATHTQCRPPPHMVSRAPTPHPQVRLGAHKCANAAASPLRKNKPEVTYKPAERACGTFQVTQVACHQWVGCLSLSHDYYAYCRYYVTPESDTGTCGVRRIRCHTDSISLHSGFVRTSCIPD